MPQLVLHSSFRARDVYRQWKLLVQRAQTSITVFTPYFDHLLLRLLQNNRGLYPHGIQIITDLVPENLLRSPNQLRTIKTALAAGIAMSAATRLHAKILLVDNTYVVVGSQNFTRAGRKNKEASVVPSLALASTPFMTVLHTWQAAAMPIDPDLIDALIHQLEQTLRQQRKVLRGLQTLIETTVVEHEQRKQEERLKALEAQSRIRLEQEEAYATVDFTWLGPTGYRSLLAESDYALTRWTQRQPDGSTTAYPLRWLWMYPVLNAHTFRMGFARIAKTRITYVRDGVTWENKKMEVGASLCRVVVQFPSRNTRFRNIEVILTNERGISSKLGLLFSGNEFKVQQEKYPGRWPRNAKQEFQAAIRTHVLTDKGLATLFADFLSHFRYQKLKRGNKDARNFFGEGRIRLSIIEYQSNPVVVATHANRKAPTNAGSPR